MNQNFRDIALGALKQNDLKINKIASEKITDSLTRADVLRRTAIYLFDNKQFIPAANRIKESFKAVNEADNGVRKIMISLQLAPSFQKIDKDGVPEVLQKTARLLDSFSFPGHRRKAG